uniref:Immunoglobulin V-set domain-containing protein n=1 Tax=Cyclopterus lumpus TaxID=8103 RepID=A0A8C2ZNS3_CYCLU
VLVQEGEDLLLEAEYNNPEDYLIVRWKFNKTVDLVRFVHDREPAVFPDFTGRIEFTGKRFSVKLKNLQLADSGVYTADVTTTERDLPLAEYKVTVQVKLSVVSVVSRSSASCDLTVNCSTQDSHISSTFTCVDGACSQEGGGGRSEVTTSGASLQVYLLNSSIVCHHSNQVHWTKDFKGTQHVCSQHAGKTEGQDDFLIIKHSFEFKK